MDTLSISVLDRRIVIECDEGVLPLLVANYGYKRASHGVVNLHYVIRRQKLFPGFVIRREGQKSMTAANDGELLFLLEKDMTIELQKLLSNLYFVHAAVIGLMGRAIMLVGPSGSGKSMTTWALLHHGFYYLSDELAPVDLTRLEVRPYLHAICLKNRPPRLYLLPEETLYTFSTIHVPIEALPGKVTRGPKPVATIFFLRYRPQASRAAVQSLSKAKAAAYLFANALNPLAHPGGGLDAAIEIAKKSVCFELFSGDLFETCALVKATLKCQFRGEEEKGFGREH